MLYIISLKVDLFLSFNIKALDSFHIKAIHINACIYIIKVHQGQMLHHQSIFTHIVYIFNIKTI